MKTGSRGPVKGNGGKDGKSIADKRMDEIARSNALTKQINKIMSKNHDGDRTQDNISMLTKPKKRK